jgi:hypothetical protein
VDRPEGRSLLPRLEAARHLLERGRQVNPRLAKAPAAVDRPRPGVLEVHLEVDVLEPTRAERPEQLEQERGRNPAPPRLGHDVEIGQAADRRPRPPEREADCPPIRLGHERELVVGDLAHLRQLLVEVRRRPGQLGVECSVEPVELGQVGRRRAPDRHGVNDPVSR